MKVYFKGHSHFIERSSSYPRLVLFFSYYVIPTAVRELLNRAPGYHKYSSLNQEILRRKLLRMTCGGVDEVHEPPLTLTSFYSFLPITPRHPDRSEGTPEWGHQAITSIQPQSGDPSSQAPQDDVRWSR